jgi:hypothetical protein
VPRSDGGSLTEVWHGRGSLVSKQELASAVVSTDKRKKREECEMTRELGKKPATSAHVDRETLEDQVRARAYELYEERGKEDGDDLDDWLRAEAELTSSKHRSATA